jgi:hypothetical protein
MDLRQRDHTERGFDDSATEGEPFTLPVAAIVDFWL